MLQNQFFLIFTFKALFSAVLRHKSGTLVTDGAARDLSTRYARF